MNFKEHRKVGEQAATIARAGDHSEQQEIEAWFALSAAAQSEGERPASYAGPLRVW